MVDGEVLRMTKRDDILLIVGVAALSTATYLLYRSKKKGNTTMTTKPQLPRGYRNNNPLNIRYSPSNKWIGAVAKNTDGVFEQFTTMAYGYRAAMQLLRKYINQYGLTTVSEIINRWAPPTENNTTGYISRVIGINGWTAAKEIDPDSKDDITKLVYAMAIVENGNSILPNWSEINQGWNLL